MPERRLWELTRIFGLKTKARRFGVLDRGPEVQPRCAPPEWADLATATGYPKFSTLARAVNEFLRYIDRNEHMIPDYGAAGVLVR